MRWRSQHVWFIVRCDIFFFDLQQNKLISHLQYRDTLCTRRGRTFESLSGPHSDASRTSDRDRIKPLPPVVVPCDVQPKTWNVLVKDVWLEEQSVGEPLVGCCDVQQKKKPYFDKPRPKPHKLRASYPGSNTFTICNKRAFSKRG